VLTDSCFENDMIRAFVLNVFNHYVTRRRASGTTVPRDCRNLLTSSLPECNGRCDRRNRLQPSLLECNDTSIEVVDHATVEISEDGCSRTSTG
jgi:hypothetical protein